MQGDDDERRAIAKVTFPCLYDSGARPSQPIVLGCQSWSSLTSIPITMTGDAPQMMLRLTRARGILKRSRLMSPAVALYSRIIGRYRSMPHTALFWEKRYAEGDDSGPGSYGRLAQFKADYINELVRSKNVKTVIECNRLAPLSQGPGIFVRGEISRLQDKAHRICEDNAQAWIPPSLAPAECTSATTISGSSTRLTWRRSRRSRRGPC